MVEIYLRLRYPGLACGEYRIRYATGYLFAIFYWGNNERVLDNWGPIAYVPIEPSGNAFFEFKRECAIPIEATHLWVWFYSYDLTKIEIKSVEIQESYRPKPLEEDQFKITALSGLCGLTGSNKEALDNALDTIETNTICLIGNLTSEGAKDEFTLIEEAIGKRYPLSDVFSVIGETDAIYADSRYGKKIAIDGCNNYYSFQNHMLKTVENTAYKIEYDSNKHSYAALYGEKLDIVGLQCITDDNKFAFSKIQIKWLDEHLSRTSAEWHLVLCHVPLRNQDIFQVDGTDIDNDCDMQDMIERHQKVIFLSWTNLSSNCQSIDNAEFDYNHVNVHINCPIVSATDMTPELESSQNELMAEDWADGCITEIAITNSSVRIIMKSLRTGRKYPRGYYHFRLEDYGC